jgi:hypothetical protein
VVGDFELAVGAVCGIGLVVEAAVGQWPTETLVEEQKEQCDLEAFCSEAVSVPGAVPLQQTVAFEFWQVITELVQSAGLWRKLECGEDGFMNLLGGPAPNGVAAVEQHLQEPDDPGVVDLDAGIPHRTDGDRQGQPLEQREIHREVEALRLEVGKAVGDDLESFPHRIQMIQSFFRPKSRRLLEQSSLRR